MGNDILNYQDFLLMESKKWIDHELNESSLPEKKDVFEFIKKIFQRMKNLSKSRKKTLLIYALTAALSITNYNEIVKFINYDKDIQDQLKDCPELSYIIDYNFNDKLYKEQFDLPEGFSFKDPTKLKLSKEGWSHLKKSEGRSLKAYELGDDKITVGWGHAEPIEGSIFSVGYDITPNKAQELLEKDAKIAADGVRRIFKDWKKEGIYRELSQNQFDVLVSMAFNMGVAGLKRTDVIAAIKDGDYIKAGNLIKKTGISSKFQKGHTLRRSKESSNFLKWAKK